MVRPILWVIHFLLGLDAGFRVFWIQTTLRSYALKISLISSILSIPYIPWCLKCLPWLCSSKYGINGYHRKPHMLLGFMGCALSFIPLSFPLPLGLFLICFFSFHWWLVWAWVNITGCVVEDTLDLEDNTKIRTQTLLLIVEATGRLIGSRFGGDIWQALPGHNTAPICGGIYTCLFLLALVFLRDYGLRREGVLSSAYGANGLPDLPVRGKERPLRVEEEIVVVSNTCTRQFQAMAELFNNKYLKAIIIFNFVYTLFPNYDVAFWYMQIEILHFTPTEMGILSSVGEFGTILALLIYYCVGGRLRINCYYVTLGLFTILTNILPLMLTFSITYEDQEKVYAYETFDLPPFLLVMGRNVFGDFFDRLHSLPPHQLANLFCRSASSAGGLAALGSAHNIVTGLGRQIDALFYHIFAVDDKSFEGLRWLVLLRQCLEIASLCVACVLPKESIKTIAKQEAAELETIVEEVVGEEFGTTTENQGVFTITDDGSIVI